MKKNTFTILISIVIIAALYLNACKKKDATPPCNNGVEWVDSTVVYLDCNGITRTYELDLDGDSIKDVQFSCVFNNNWTCWEQNTTVSILHPNVEVLAEVFQDVYCAVPTYNANLNDTCWDYYNQASDCSAANITRVETLVYPKLFVNQSFAGLQSIYSDFDFIPTTNTLVLRNNPCNTNPPQYCSNPYNTNRTNLRYGPLSSYGTLIVRINQTDLYAIAIHASVAQFMINRVEKLCS